jgi:hypothetical protein
VIDMLLAVAEPGGVAGEVVAHPYLTMTVVGALFSALVAIVKIFLSLFEKRVNEKFDEIKKREDDLSKHVDEKFKGVAEREEKQEVRLDKIDSDLRGYDKHVAVGIKETSEINASVQRVEKTLLDHTEKEETTTWGKIDGLVTAVNELKISNESAHAGLVAGQTIHAARLDAIEKKMPNGELEKLANAYHELALLTDKSRDLEEYARLAEMDRNHLSSSRKRATSKHIPPRKRVKKAKR